MSISKISSNENENKNKFLFKDQTIFDNIDNYKFESKLGEGRFGKVRLAFHKLTNQKVAIKIIDKNHIKIKEHRQRVDSEISILKQVNHYNISKLISVIENEERIYLVQEYINGSDLNIIIKKKENPKIKEQKALYYFRQIISAVEYIHKLSIAHRDLKPENILINEKNDIKLIDFGLGKIFSKGELLKTQCGSPFYASPEMINGDHYNGINSDIWSLGVILYLMLFEVLPFMDAEVKRLYKKIIEGKYEIPEDKINEVSNKAIDLISKILEVNPKKRIKISGIKSHPWFNQVSDILYEGINAKDTILPIDEEIVEEINKNYGYDKMRIRNSIIRNLFNYIRSLYFVLLEKKIREGKESVSDLYSKLYLDYVHNEKNKMVNYENNIENVLKERMNSKEKLDTIPNYEENKDLYNNENKNMFNERRGRKVRTQTLDISDICNIETDNKLKDALIRIKKNKKKERNHRNNNNNFLISYDNNIQNSKLESFTKMKTNDFYNLKEYRQKLSERINMEINRSINNRNNKFEICSDSCREKSEKQRLNSNINRKIDNLKTISLNQRNILTNHNTNAHHNSSSANSKRKKIMNKSRTNKKYINNIKNKNNSLFISCDNSRPIGKTAIGHILYKNNETDINENKELFNTNRSSLVKMNLNKKHVLNKNISNLNKKYIKEKTIASLTKTIDIQETNHKVFLSFLGNSRSPMIKKRFYINKKLNVPSLPNETPNKNKMVQGKTMSNFYKVKNNFNSNFGSAKISSKNIRANNHKGKIIKIETKTISNMKGKKTQKFMNFKTNSNLFRRKQRNRLTSLHKELRYLNSEKTGNTNVSNSITNMNNFNSVINENNKVNNENIIISKKMINPYSTINNFNILNKSNNSLIITNFSSKERNNSQGKKITVNIVNKENFKIKNENILLSSIKKPKNKKRNILNQNKIDNENHIIFDEKKFINCEYPFDLNCLIIPKNNLKIKESFEKHLNYKKISFNCFKDKISSNNNQISFNCSKKNGIKFKVKLSKIKKEYNNENNNLYICKIRKLSDIKYDYFGLINSFSL